MTIYSNGDKTAYGIKHYDLDTIEDIALINKSNLTPGSTIFIINSSKYYKLNSKKQWVEIFPNGRGNSSSNDSGNGSGNESGPAGNYDGGSIDNSDPV